MPWTDPLSTSALTSSSLAQDLFEIVVVLALVVTVALLAISYVIRMAVLQVLIATAPLAALATILPETRGYARTWGRLFVVALFMQAAQVMVLRVATVTGLAAGSGLAATLYALAALWVSLKVPRFPRLGGRRRPGLASIGSGLAGRHAGSRCPCRLAGADRHGDAARDRRPHRGACHRAERARRRRRGRDLRDRDIRPASARPMWPRSCRGSRRTGATRMNGWSTRAAPDSPPSAAPSLAAVHPGDVAVIAAGTRTGNGTASGDGHVGIVTAVDRRALTVTLSSENWPEGDHSPRPADLRRR